MKLASLGYLTLLTILVTSCSAGSTGESVGLIEPDIRVRQLTGQMLPRTDVDTDISLQIDIFNRSGETIILERIELRSTPTSDVNYRSATRQLTVEIPPGEVRTVDLWVEARLINPRADVTSPVTVRGTAIFDSGVGRFRKVFVEPVIVYRPDTGE